MLNKLESMVIKNKYGLASAGKVLGYLAEIVGISNIARFSCDKFPNGFNTSEKIFVGLTAIISYITGSVINNYINKVRK